MMMKKILTVLSVALLFSIAAFSQDASQPARLKPILQTYFGIKNALVDSKSTTAADSARSFAQQLNGLSYQLLSEGNVEVLVKDALAVADGKSIEKQRAAFANLSRNMKTLAEHFSLSDSTVYLQYCPMKQAWWLSEEKTIRNPYYGAAMPGCGEVKNSFN